MIEVLDTQIIPAAATAAGFAVGALAERKAIDKAAGDRQSLVEVWSLDGEQTETVRKQPGRIEKLARRAGRYATALTVSSALAGGLAAEAWLPLTEHAGQQTPPALEVVVDHSGATALPLDGKPAIGEINKVVNQLEGIQNVNAEAWVAGSGQAKVMALDKVASAPTFGDAPLEQATQSALGRAGFAAAKRQGPNEHDASVVVITNGNAIGSAAAVAAEAKAKGNPPVFVVNVEGAKSDAVSSLQSIARRTHGQYWDVQSDNLNTVAAAAKKAITANQHEAQAKPAVTDGTRTMLRFFSILSLAGAAVAFAQRRKTPFQRDIRGE